MASTPYPLPRETRETSTLVGNGTVGPYGPTPFKVFDVADVEVWTKPAGARHWGKVAATLTKTSGQEYDTVSAMFPEPLPATTAYRISGRRTHERNVSVFKGGTIASDQLERELSKQAVVISELRRDVSNTVQLDPGAGGMIISKGSAGQTMVFDEDGNVVPGLDLEETLNGETSVFAGYKRDTIAARDDAARYASDAVSQGSVPIYATMAGMAGLAVPAAVSAIRVNGRITAGDGDGGLFVAQNNGSNDTFVSGDGRTWYRAFEARAGSYATISAMAGITVPAELNAIRVNGRNTVGDGDGGSFVSTNNGSTDTFVSADGRTWYRAFELQTGAKAKPTTAGSVARSLISVLFDRPPSVAWYGAVGGGYATRAQDTAAINAALAAHRAVFIPPGDFRPTAPLQTQPGGAIHGAGFELTRINRADFFAGNTIEVGSQANGSGNFHITGLFIDNPHPGFDAATSTTLGSNRLTGNQAHIKVWGGTKGKIDRCYIQNGVYNVSVDGHTGLIITENTMLGVWDAANTDRQECKANIRLGKVAGLPYTTENRIFKNYLAGVSNVERTITMPGASGSFVARLDGGPQYAIYLQSVEGVKIFENYIGANNSYGIFILGDAGGVITNVIIEGNFFDGARLASIGIYAPSGFLNNIIGIRGNQFNGQLITPNVLEVGAAGSSYSTASLIFENNQSNAHLKTAMLLPGLRGGIIRNNIISAYNSRRLFDAAIDGNAGAYVSNQSREVHFSGNLWGGGINDMSATSSSNGAKYGVVGDGTATGSTSNERAILQASIAGGLVVEGGNFRPQTYPTNA